MAVEKIEEFVGQSIASIAVGADEVVAQLGERVKKGSESTAIGNEIRDSDINYEENKHALNSAKAGFSGLMKELAEQSASVEGALAGKTSNVADLWKFIFDTTKVLDFNDPKKLADFGKIPLKNRTSTGRFDKEVYGETYGHCEECGKPLKKPSKDGFCSLVCALKHCQSNVTCEITDLKEKEENLMAKLNAVVQLTNTFANQISKTTAELAALPGRALDSTWEVYFKVKLTNLRIYLKRNINDLLIEKNNWMMHQADKGKMLLGGAVFDSLGSMAKIKAAAEKAEALCAYMNSLYDKAYNAVVNALAPFKLEPESMNFNMTIRSNTYFPGKMAVKLKNFNQPDSIANVVNVDKIMDIVEGAFPHITQDEYVMDPEAFNSRKLRSEYNVKAIKTMIDNLMPTMKMGSEPLPKYEDLKVTNVWWMVFLTSSFLPQGQKHYALPFCP